MLQLNTAHNPSSVENTRHRFDLQKGNAVKRAITALLKMLPGLVEQHAAALQGVQCLTKSFTSKFHILHVCSIPTHSSSAPISGQIHA